MNTTQRKRRGAPSKGNRKNRRKNLKNGPGTNNSFRQVLPRQQLGPGYLEPSQKVQTLRFVRSFVLTAAAPSQAKRFITNDIYRPDPSSFAHPSIGFIEYQTEYSLFRVISYRYQLEIFNNEAFPVAVYVINSNQDPSVSASLTDSGQDNVQRATIAPKGGIDKKVLRKTFRIVDIVGSESPETDDDYRGTMSSGSEASPADKTWMAIGAQSLTGANITNGITVCMWLFQTTRLYDREFMTQAATSALGYPLVPIPLDELAYYAKEKASQTRAKMLKELT